MADEEETIVQLSDYPLKFDDTALDFFPSEWSRELQKITNTNQSEGGQDIVQVIRNKKLSVPVSTSVADRAWVSFFEEYYEKEEFTLSIYSPRLNGYETKRCRIEQLSIKPRKRSEELTAVTGVWDVSFTIQEF